MALTSIEKHASTLAKILKIKVAALK